MRKGRVLGAGSLRRKLKRMPDEIKKTTQDAIKRGAEVIYFDALSMVPVDDGDLAGSLHKKISSDKLGASVGWWKKGNLRNWRRAGWRAHFTEFGTRGYQSGDTRQTKNSKTTKKIKRNIPARPAQPSIGPAMLRNEKTIVKWIRAGVNHSLKKGSNL